ncbi:MAG: glycosyltransferase family 4 protein [Vicinamibacterales bacterium]
MRIVIDYRPALRARSGVGEYVHQLARALRRLYPDDALTLFTSSLRDRPASELSQVIPGARVSDHRIPVQLLNLVWHRLEWPPVESCIGEACDVAFSPHPLLLPARRAAQVVMVHDLDFMRHPERTHREIRRDYPRLAGPHARRADHVIVPSQYTADEVHRILEVPREHIAVCPPGVPEWQSPGRGFDRHGYLLFMGSLEPRKNVATLLAAYRRLLAGRADAPKLALAGKAGPEANAGLDSLTKPPLRGNVEHLGYVAESERQRVYAGARALVLPSFDEGFGMPVLEAMSLGIPVIASARGALPELVGEAGLLIDPTDELALCEALARVVTDDALAQILASRGLARARLFSWDRTAAAVRQVFMEAVLARASVSRLDATSRIGQRRVPRTETIRLRVPRVDEATVRYREP